MARPSEKERFFSKVRIIPGGCWEWLATIIQGQDGGYGVFFAYDPQHEKKRNMPAHRWSYNHHHGPIPSGMIVMHKCDNRRCVHPEHLKLGTLRENARDMVEKGRWRGAVGEKHFNTVLNARKVETIRRKYASGVANQRQLGEECGVSQSTIGRIVRGEVWADTPGPKGPGRPHLGERHHAAKITSSQVQEIRQAYAAGGVTQRELGKKHGVTEKHIGEILREKKRKNG